MLSVLSNFENPAPVRNRHTGGLDMDLVIDLPTRKTEVSKNPVVAYALPARMARATVQTAREMCLEIVGEYARSVRFISPAIEEALRQIDHAWPSVATRPSKNIMAWLTVVNDAKSETTVPALYKTISGVLSSMKEGDGVMAVDISLQEIDVNNASLHHTIAVLRTLSAHKAKLEHWKALRERLRQAVENRRGELKVAPEVFMRGLWQDE